MAYPMRLLSFFLTALCASQLFAQSPLKAPLTFVAADSVVVWGEGYADLRGVALTNVSATLVPRTVTASSKDFKTLRKAWNKQWLPTLTLHGVRAERGDSPALTATEALKAASKLFLLTANGELMDACERLLYNDLLRYVLTPSDGSYEKYTAAQALMSSAGLIYATDSEGLWVNLFVNNTAHVKTAHHDFVVDQLTAMPFTGRVKVRLSAMPTNGYPLTLRLRMPVWAMGGVFPADRFKLDNRTCVKPPTVYVNGHELLTTKMENGYVIISRQWNRGDEVLVDFPLRQLYVSEKRAESGEPFLLRGALLYTPVSGSANALSAIPLDSLRLEEGVADVPIFKYKSFTAIPYFLKDLMK